MARSVEPEQDDVRPDHSGILGEGLGAEHPHRPDHSGILGEGLGAEHPHRPDHSGILGEGLGAEHPHRPDHSGILGEGLGAEHPHRPDHCGILGEGLGAGHPHRPDHSGILGEGLGAGHPHRPDHSGILGEGLGAGRPKTALLPAVFFLVSVRQSFGTIVWSVKSQAGLWATCKVPLSQHSRVDCQLSRKALGDFHIKVPDVSPATCTSRVAVVRHSRATVSSQTGLWATCKFKFQTFPLSRVSLVDVVGDKMNNVAVLQQGGRRFAENDPSWEDTDATALGRQLKNRPAWSIQVMPGFVNCH